MFIFIKFLLPQRRQGGGVGGRGANSVRAVDNDDKAGFRVSGADGGESYDMGKHPFWHARQGRWQMGQRIMDK